MRRALQCQDLEGEPVKKDLHLSTWTSAWQGCLEVVWQQGQRRRKRR
eukprot:CAMPEP_0196589778 /NCGR_PEP_ID=MMETSP1081-20130531/64590_1 /TAXON_ID=36882 /ORGANISM="Pyramimonas amylifera, Strain CCMP720" /LENGTH=46 /DNA_ID= /DNA_START= /DNA_END= /DNA_ORIENTATION=